MTLNVTTIFLRVTLVWKMLFRPIRGLITNARDSHGVALGSFMAPVPGLRDARLARILVARGNSQNRSHREMIGRDASIPLSAIDACVDH